MFSTKGLLLQVLACTLVLTASALPAPANTTILSNSTTIDAKPQGHDWSGIQVFHGFTLCNGNDWDSLGVPRQDEPGPLASPCWPQRAFSAFHVEGAWLGWKIWKDSSCRELANINVVYTGNGDPARCFLIAGGQALAVSYNSP